MADFAIGAQASRMAILEEAAKAMAANVGDMRVGSEHACVAHMWKPVRVGKLPLDAVAKIKGCLLQRMFVKMSAANSNSKRPRDEEAPESPSAEVCPPLAPLAIAALENGSAVQSKQLLEVRHVGWETSHVGSLLRILCPSADASHFALVTLDLECNAISDDVVPLLDSAVGGGALPSLRNLFLASNSLTGLAMDALVEGSKSALQAQNTSLLLQLEDLGLTNNKMSSASLVSFVRYIATCQHAACDDDAAAGAASAIPLKRLHMNHVCSLGLGEWALCVDALVDFILSSPAVRDVVWFKQNAAAGVDLSLTAVGVGARLGDAAKKLLL